MALDSAHARRHDKGRKKERRGGKQANKANKANKVKQTKHARQTKQRKQSKASKQTNKGTKKASTQTTKQPNNQTNKAKQTHKQTNKQTNNTHTSKARAPLVERPTLRTGRAFVSRGPLTAANASLAQIVMEEFNVLHQQPPQQQTQHRCNHTHDSQHRNAPRSATPAWRLTRWHVLSA